MTTILLLYVLRIAAGVFVGASLWRILRWASRAERRIQALERAVMPPPPAGAYRMLPVRGPLEVLRDPPKFETMSARIEAWKKLNDDMQKEIERLQCRIIPPDPKEVSE